MARIGEAPDRQRLREALDSGLDVARQRWTLTLNEDQRERLVAYIDLLHRWNRVDNLTAVRDPLQMVRRHILDSLSVADQLEGDSVADLGSGAGLPGIPLAIACPQREFTLVDSAAKRIRFMQQACAELALPNAQPLKARAEEVEGCYAHTVSRAFTSLVGFVSLSRRLVEKTGSIMALKGPVPHTELESLASQGLAVKSVELFVPGEAAERNLIVVRAV